VVHLEPPTDAEPLPLRLELVPTGPSGDELPPIACPRSARAARARVTGLTDDDLAVVRSAAYLERMLALGVHRQARSVVADLVVDLLPALAGVDLRFRGRPVRVDWQAIRPRLRATAVGDRLALDWVPRPVCVWRLWPGLALTDAWVLQPIGEEVPAGVLRLLGTELPAIERDGLDAFVRELVVDRGVDVELPDGVVHAVAPTDRERRLLLAEEGDTLVIRWAVGYRTPTETVEVRGGRPGRYARVGETTVLRDAAFEQETAQLFAYAVGTPHAARFPAEHALVFLTRDLPTFRPQWHVLGEDRLLRFRKTGVLTPSVGVARDHDWFDVRVEFRLDDLVLSAAQALELWRDGRRYVALPDGTMALLPARWLHRHAGRLEELAETTAANPQPGPFAAGIVTELLEEEGHGALWTELSAALATPAGRRRPRRSAGRCGRTSGRDSAGSARCATAGSAGCSRTTWGSARPCRSSRCCATLTPGRGRRRSWSPRRRWRRTGSPRRGGSPRSCRCARTSAGTASGGRSRAWTWSSRPTGCCGGTRRFRGWTGGTWCSTRRSGSRTRRAGRRRRRTRCAGSTGSR
jgi:hypothetical protein